MIHEINSEITLKVLVVSLLVFYNISWIAIVAIMVKLVVMFPGLRNFIKGAIENGDNIPHHEDANKALILAFAIGAGWMLGNLFLLAAFDNFSQGWMIAIGTLSVIFLGLLGIKKWNSTH